MKTGKALSLVGGSQEKSKTKERLFFSANGHFRGYIIARVNST